MKALARGAQRTLAEAAAARQPIHREMWRQLVKAGGALLLCCAAGGVVLRCAWLLRAQRWREPRRIILIRHAESEGNLDRNVFCFMPDWRIPLTRNGRSQAERAGRQLAEMVGSGPVRFWVSPYRRTRETLEILERQLVPGQASVREEPRLREQDWGNFQNYEAIAECRRVRSLFGTFYYRFPSGESGADVFDRVSSFLQTMFRDIRTHPEFESVVIVSHGLTCRLFLMRYLHWSVEQFQHTANLNHCEMVVMEPSPEDGRFRLVSKLRTYPMQVNDEWDTLASAAQTMQSAKLKHLRCSNSSVH